MPLEEIQKKKIYSSSKIRQPKVNKQICIVREAFKHLEL